jgi:hypothetical protein
MLVPLFLTLLLGILELGTAFNHHLALEYASREGARSGAALAHGGGFLGCSSGQSPNAATVDPLIIEAVQRVLESPGSPIALSDVTQIRIYKSDPGGGEAGPVNVWTYTPDAGPMPANSTSRLDFSPSTVSWAVCTRRNTEPADKLGVSLTYRYTLRTGLGSLMRMTSPGGLPPTITMTDRTVMDLNPTSW